MQNSNGNMQYRIKWVTFYKPIKGGGLIRHHARIISYIGRKLLADRNN